MGERSNKRTIKAIVVSNKMDKTIVVRAQRLVKHSVFHKYVPVVSADNVIGDAPFGHTLSAYTDVAGV